MLPGRPYARSAPSVTLPWKQEVRHELFVPRFQSVLPAKKVVRFFQVDNKLDKKIEAEPAMEIPLTR
jgi:hypothetical protein